MARKPVSIGLLELMKIRLPTTEFPNEAVLREAKDLARAEIARRRRRLGRLTREQEIGIETLMISTVTRISELVARVESITEGVR